MRRGRRLPDLDVLRLDSSERSSGDLHARVHADSSTADHADGGLRGHKSGHDRHVDPDADVLDERLHHGWCADHLDVFRLVPIICATGRVHADLRGAAACDTFTDGGLCSYESGHDGIVDAITHLHVFLSRTDIIVRFVAAGERACWLVHPYVLMGSATFDHTRVSERRQPDGRHLDKGSHLSELDLLGRLVPAADVPRDSATEHTTDVRCAFLGHEERWGMGAGGLSGLLLDLQRRNVLQLRAGACAAACVSVWRQSGRLDGNAGAAMLDADAGSLQSRAAAVCESIRSVHAEQLLSHEFPGSVAE